MKKIASVVVMLSLFALLFTACGGKDDKNALVGTWNMASIEMGGESLSLDDPDLAALGFDQVDYSITFTDDGKVTMTEMGMEVEGTYTVDGTAVTVDVDGQSADLTFENDVLSMVDDSMGGVGIVFKKA